MKKLVGLCLFIATSVFGQQYESDIVIKNKTITGNEPPVIATKSIILKPNTWIKPGASFHAFIYSDELYRYPILSNENYVFTRIYQTPQKNAVTSQNATNYKTKDFIESVSYFDGLGRPKQNVAIRQSAGKKDIVTHIGYDEFGRQDKDFLPYATSSANGSIKTGAASATLNYYKRNYGDDFDGVTVLDEINAFSQKKFEASPLNRILQQAAPGKDWKLGNGHEIAFSYETNTNNEVKLFKVSIVENTEHEVITYVPSLVNANGNSYAAGTLFKTVTKDENHDGTASKLHTTEEFKNKQGQVILKRTYAKINGAEVAHDTYYVYDDYGNLTYVLPPKVTTQDGTVSASELSELCYQYTYDFRNRLVEKQLPGKK